MDARSKVIRGHRAIAWFYGVVGVLYSAVAIADLSRGFSIFHIVIPVVFLLAVSAHIYTAKACALGRPAGKTASIVLGVLMLPLIPIGTLLGALLLVNSCRTWSDPTESQT
jgi:hypothetical protein